MIDPRLEGRVAAVTGASRGIGGAIVRALAAQGAKVLVHCWPETEAGWAADLSLPASIPALFDRAEATLGPVEILVCNAAHWEADTFVPVERGARDRIDRALSQLDAGAHDRHFAVNSRATALLIAEMARRHAARGAAWGRIVTVSTDGAGYFPQEVSYGASKAALEAYSRSAAKELGPLGITVNVVSPGPTQTGWITEAHARKLIAEIPLGRVGEPEDIADAVVFLASEQARWISGQTLHVGGGGFV